MDAKRSEKRVRRYSLYFAYTEIYAVVGAAVLLLNAYVGPSDKAYASTLATAFMLCVAAFANYHRTGIVAMLRASTPSI